MPATRSTRIDDVEGERRVDQCGVVGDPLDLEVNGAARSTLDDGDAHDVTGVQLDHAGHRVERADAVRSAAHDREWGHVTNVRNRTEGTGQTLLSVARTVLEAMDPLGAP